MTKPSPVPWHVLPEPLYSVHPIAIASADEEFVVADCYWDVDALTREVAEANAALIVRAVNAHDAMLATIKNFLAAWAKAEPGLIGAFMLQHVHGGTYTGPSVAAEVEAMRAVVADCEAVP